MKQFMLFCMLLISVQSFGQKKIQSVTIKQNGCKGTCPMYDYTINQSGYILYEGKRYCDSIGKFKINIGVKKAKAILLKLENKKILTLPDSYPMKIADAPSISYLIKTKTGDKSIIRANLGPSYLISTQKDIELLIKKYKWTKIEE